MEQIIKTKNSQALLNEYKGNVFEFLVANSLARQYEILPKFLNSIEDSFYSILEQQQLFIHQYYPDHEIGWGCVKVGNSFCINFALHCIY